MDEHKDEIYDEEELDYLRMVEGTLSEWESEEDCEAYDDLRPEYDFNTLGSGAREKDVEAPRNKSNFVLLEPDVAKHFPNQEAVNVALRSHVASRHQD